MKIKMKSKIMLALLAFGAPVFVATAQDAGGPPPDDGGPGGHRHPPLPLVMALDVNHDGVIDASEIANASAALKTLDTNGDGQLTKDEYLPPHPPSADGSAPPPPHHHPQPTIIGALDANHDGVIDAAEIANATAALKTLDTNHDGVLTADEYIGKRPPRPGNSPNGGQNPPDDGPPGPPPQDN
jgi:hypothetical protein